MSSEQMFSEENIAWNPEVMSWVEQLCSPIEGKPSAAGVDPRYDDLFIELKAEVEKKQDVNYKQIKDLAENVITQVGKDVRAAGYYLLAASKLEGALGLFKGILLLLKLLENFDGALFPEKDKARRMALLWPLQSKILIFVQKNDDAPSLKLTQNLKKAFDALCVLAKKHTEDFGWPDLNTWLAKTEKQLVEKENLLSSSAKNNNASPSGTSDLEHNKTQRPASHQAAGIKQSNAGVEVISSDAQLVQTHRQLLKHYRSKQEYGAMVCLARAVKWGDLKLPANENNKTRVPAPRDASINKIRAAYESENWIEAFLAAEDAFMESGGLFSFDIQRWSAVSAQKAGLKSVYVNIELLVHALLTRLPNLKRLSFENGVGFFTGAGAAWYEQVESQFKVSSNNAEQDDYLTKARTLKEEKGLAMALAWLKKEQGSDIAQQLTVQLAQACICYEEGLTDAALALLDALDKQVDETNTSVLLPNLAMKIWRQKYLALKDVIGQSSDQESKSHTERELLRLQSRMCATDVSLAVDWL
ncbi:TssA family type VI secretion system protein [Marinomonas balearica]|uniref:Type VI secretion system protein VasJ n=1 Tax=Marinomonas balearica TaxID=491947 RepID=A0A4R6M4B1_9GAMM|nr:TssA family type VI secretion system protein [Marinomonas balearica]TDO95535.1 type VI secretion system protein VasJ [Marinomonas balearica]